MLLLKLVAILIDIRFDSHFIFFLFLDNGIFGCWTGHNLLVDGLLLPLSVESLIVLIIWVLLIIVGNWVRLYQRTLLPCSPSLSCLLYLCLRFGQLWCRQHLLLILRRLLALSVIQDLLIWEICIDIVLFLDINGLSVILFNLLCVIHVLGLFIFLIALEVLAFISGVFPWVELILLHLACWLLILAQTSLWLSPLLVQLFHNCIKPSLEAASVFLVKDFIFLDVPHLCKRLDPRRWFFCALVLILACSVYTVKLLGGLGQLVCLKRWGWANGQFTIRAGLSSAVSVGPATVGCRKLASSFLFFSICAPQPLLLLQNGTFYLQLVSKVAYVGSSSICVCTVGQVDLVLALNHRWLLGWVSSTGWSSLWNVVRDDVVRRSSWLLWDIDLLVCAGVLAQ